MNACYVPSALLRKTCPPVELLVLCNMRWLGTLAVALAFFHTSFSVTNQPPPPDERSSGMLGFLKNVGGKAKDVLGSPRGHPLRAQNQQFPNSQESRGTGTSLASSVSSFVRQLQRPISRRFDKVRQSRQMAIQMQNDGSHQSQTFTADRVSRSFGQSGIQKSRSWPGRRGGRNSPQAMIDKVFGDEEGPSKPWPRVDELKRKKKEERLMHERMVKEAGQEHPFKAKESSSPRTIYTGAFTY